MIDNPVYRRVAEVVQQDLAAVNIKVNFTSSVAGAVHGDLGQSIRFRVPAAQLMMERLLATFELTVVAMLLAVAVAIPLGVITAVRHDTAVADWR